jgi:hypothetical protein
MPETERPTVPSPEEAGRRYDRGRHDAIQRQLTDQQHHLDHLDKTVRELFAHQLEPIAARLDYIEAALLEMRALHAPRASKPAPEAPGAVIDLNARARTRKTKPAPEAPAPEPQTPAPAADAAPAPTQEE